MKSDLLPALQAACDGELRDFDLRWNDLASVAVVMAARGYPEAPERGSVIKGLDAAAAMPGVSVFHAGTEAGPAGTILAGGGRVLSCVYYFHREPKAFEGGALRIHAFGSEEDAEFVDIEPRQNSLLVFPAWAPHEVRTVSCPSDAFADARFSVNCWLHRARPE